MALAPLAKDMAMMCAVEWYYGATGKLLHMLQLYQLVLQLVGRSDDAIHDYQDRLNWDGKSGEVASFSYSLHLYVYQEEWDQANEVYDKLIDLDIGPLRSFPIWHSRVFFFIVVEMHRARKTTNLFKRRKWLRIIEKHMELVRMWVLERKAINLVHKLQLLEALAMTTKSRNKYPSDATLEAAFGKAIFPASRAGLFQDAGLAAALAAPNP